MKPSTGLFMPILPLGLVPVFLQLSFVSVWLSVVWDLLFAKKRYKRNKFVFKDPFWSKNNFSVIGNVSESSRAKKFGKYIPLLVGCVMEAMGYIARAISSFDTSALVPYIIQSVLLLVAPALMAATIYMLFGRMLVLLRCKSLSIVPSRFSTTIFVTGDILSFFLQAAGGGLMSQEGSTSIGSNLIVAGLFVQIAFFGLFLITELRFALQVNKVSTVLGHENSWKFLNWTLIITSFLMLGTSILRVVEFIQRCERIHYHPCILHLLLWCCSYVHGHFDVHC